MTKVDQVASTYDKVYKSGGYKGIYYLPHKQSPYLPLFKRALKELRNRKVNCVVDVGCGVGAFASYLMAKTDIQYWGFDFSPEAVKQAIQRTNCSSCFEIADARQIASYPDRYDAIVCLEVLEHVLEDLHVISQWARGSLCVCSVPNFDSKYHVRHFSSGDDVVNRYGALINIERIMAVRMPYVDNLRWQSYAVAVLRNWRKPRSLANIAGCRPWNAQRRLWFVFVGTKR